MCLRGFASQTCSSGRSSHLIDPAMAFHFLDLAFSSRGFRVFFEWFEVHQFPRPSVLDPNGAVVLVLDCPGTLLKRAVSE